MIIHDEYKRMYDFDDTMILTPLKKYPWKLIFAYPNPKINKEDVKVVITGRGYSCALLTWLQIKIFGFKNVHTIIFNPCRKYDKDHLIMFKMYWLLMHNVKEYIDNEGWYKMRLWEAGWEGSCLSVEEVQKLLSTN